MAIEINLETADVTVQFLGGDAQFAYRRRLVIRSWDAPEDGSKTVYLTLPVGLAEMVAAILPKAERSVTGAQPTWRETRQAVVDAITKAPSAGIRFGKLLLEVCVEASALEQVLNTLRLEGTAVKEGMDTYRLAGVPK